LSQVRKTRDRIEKTGASSSFGGISFSNAAYDAVLRRITKLEAALFDAEVQQEGLDVRSDERIARISSL
jgi:hypothetical protein